MADVNDGENTRRPSPHLIVYYNHRNEIEVLNSRDVFVFGDEDCNLMDDFNYYNCNDRLKVIITAIRKTMMTRRGQIEVIDFPVPCRIFGVAAGATDVQVLRQGVSDGPQQLYESLKRDSNLSSDEAYLSTVAQFGGRFYGNRANHWSSKGKFDPHVTDPPSVTIQWPSMDCVREIIRDNWPDITVNLDPHFLKHLSDTDDLA